MVHDGSHGLRKVLPYGDQNGSLFVCWTIIFDLPGVNR